MMGNGPPASTLGALAYIARHEGVGALYNGIWLTWVKQAPQYAGAHRCACKPCPAVLHACSALADIVPALSPKGHKGLFVFVHLKGLATNGF